MLLFFNVNEDSGHAECKTDDMEKTESNKTAKKLKAGSGNRSRESSF